MHSRSLPSSRLENPIVAEPIRHIIGHRDQKERDGRFEQAHGRRRRELHIEQTETLHERVDDIRIFVHRRIVQNENLIEAGIQDAADA